jgi:hypothetical protein
MGELTRVCQRCRLACRCARLLRCVSFYPRPGEVMPPRIGLALVLCFVFPWLVLGVDILMDPNGDGSRFLQVSPVAVQILLTFTTKKVISSQTQLICWSRFWVFSPLVHCFNFRFFFVLFWGKTVLALPTRQLRHAQRLHTL